MARNRNVTTTTIRNWAVENEIPVSSRGRVSQEVVAQFAKAKKISKASITIIPAAPANQGPQIGEVRTWALDNGFEVPLRGRISKAVHEAFEKAHGFDIVVPAPVVDPIHEAVRSWAKEQGIPVGERGVVSHELLDQFEVANGAV